MKEEGKFDVIRRFKSDYPVDVRLLAIALGVSVYRSEMSDHISGKLVNKGGSPPIFEIHVNSSHSENRMRFTIAHEIAHYILHRDLVSDSVIDNELYRSAQISDHFESQANAFAAELLMPQRLIAVRYNQLAQTWRSPDQITEEMATEFKVSRDAMRIRLKTVVQMEMAI